MLIDQLFQSIANFFECWRFIHTVVPALKTYVMLWNLCIKRLQDLVKLAKEDEIDPSYFRSCHMLMLAKLIVHSFHQLSFKLVEVYPQSLLEFFLLKILGFGWCKNFKRRASNQLARDVAHILEEVAM